MSELVQLLIANALAAGLLALAAWVASRRLRRQTLVHGLWVLALVKLVTPPIVPLPLLPEWTMPNLSLPDGPAVVVVETPAATDPTVRESDVVVPTLTAVELLLAAEGVELPGLGTGATPSSFARVAASGVAPAGPLPSDPLPYAESGTVWSAVDLALVAWTGLLGGALVVALLAVLRIRRFQRLLRLAFPPSPSLSGRVTELAERVGLRRAPSVFLLPARVPPMLWPGRQGPLLLMPADLLPELSDEERDTLLVHELAHVRRRDHWVRMIELAATVLFWWYPVTWWVRRALRRAEERCCDEWVLHLMPASAKAYAEGLLKSLDFVAGEPDPLPTGASGAGPVRDLEARLKEILMTTRPIPRLAAPARLALAATALLGLAVFPTQAESPPDEVEPTLAAPSEAPPELPAAPGGPETADATPPAPEAPAMPASPVAPAEAAVPVTTVTAAPAPLADVPAPALAAPAIPTPPAPPAPVVAPWPEPRPEAAPVPRVPNLAVAPPLHPPHPAPRAVPVVAPPAPVPVVAPPAPLLAPATPDESPEDAAARKEFEAQHRKLEDQRAELHRRELELARQQMERESQAQQKELQAEAERLRANGEAERAALVEEHARTAAKRLEVQQHQLELEQAQMSDAMERKQALQKTAQRLRTLEREGQTEEAAELRKKLMQLEREHMRRSLKVEEQKMALRMRAFEIEHQAQLAEMKFAEDAAVHDRATMEAEIERARARQEWEFGVQQREIEVRQAEKALQASEIEIHEHDAAGRHDEAEAARAEAEAMRQEVDALRRGIHEDHLLRATAELELQIEAQLDALRHIEKEGASDVSEVEKEIRRLEAALRALSDTEK
jgi:beta-lactamase regulating signal transducer with metallopeptidase domain